MTKNNNNCEHNCKQPCRRCKTKRTIIDKHRNTNTYSENQDSSDRMHTCEAKARKVLFICIDGMRSDALSATPNMATLLCQPNVRYSSFCHVPTPISGPSWTTIFTGMPEEKHGITSNPELDQKRPAVSTIFDHIDHRNRSGHCRQQHIISSWEAFQNIATSGKTNVIRHNKSVSGNDKEVFLKTRDMLQHHTQVADVVTNYYMSVDSAGHHHGFGHHVHPYTSALRTVDRYVGEICEMIHKREEKYNEEWLILIMSDHGGTHWRCMTEHMQDAWTKIQVERAMTPGYDGVHGLAIDSHAKVPILLVSSRICNNKHGEILPSPQTIDVVPTVCEHLRIPTPQGCKGIRLLTGCECNVCCTKSQNHSEIEIINSILH